MDIRFTPVGFANALKAGIAANFAPPNQAAETAKLSEMLTDMAMALEMDVMNPDSQITNPAKQKQLMTYMELLGQVAAKLDE